MLAINPLKHSLLSLTLLAVSCGSGDETTKAPQARAATSPVEDRATADSVRPEDLLRNGRRPFAGEALLVGGQPTSDQLERAHELGYRTLINLRLPDEKDNTDSAQIQGLGMTYVSIPISGSVDLTEENARALADALATAQWPVIVHCASGNRVGGLFAMKAFYIDGSSPEEALAVGKAAGMTRLEPTVREKLGLPAD